MNATADTALIELSGIAKSYGGVRALRGVSMQLHPGEVHAVLGQNGAGKSTLIKVLAGAVRPDDGRITKLGEVLTLHSPADSIRAGIAVVHQELLLLPDLPVWQNVTASAPERWCGRFVARQRSRQAARKALDRLGADIPLDAPVGALPLSQQQLVEIARALHLGGRVIVLDEPNSALANAETERLLRIVRALADDGHSVLLVSHRLDEVYSVADRVTVLRDGSVVLTQEADRLDVETAIEQMVGEAAGEAAERAKPARDSSARPMLELRAMTTRAVGPIDLTIAAGEIVGLAGLQGSGAEELLQAVGGVSGGSAVVTVDGQRRTIHKPLDAIRHGVVFVPPDRKTQGLWLERSVEQNLVAGRLSAVSRAGIIGGTAARRFAVSWIERLGIRTAGPGAPVGALSGGNQQRVLLGRSLAMRPGVLLLSEPTRGVDVGAKADIHARLRELAQTQIAICITSSELSELLAVSDRLICFRRGQIVASGLRSEFDEARVLAIIGGHQ